MRLPMTIALMLLALPAAAPAQLPDRLTSSPEAYATAAVTFPSSSPFTPTSAKDAPAATGEGRLFMPSAASAEAPVPAVVMLHGAGGIGSNRELTYGPQLATHGVAAIVIDSFEPRRELWGGGFTQRLVNVTESMLIADAYAALHWLADDPRVDPERIALVGFSYGGMASLYALNAEVARRFAPGGRRFAGHVSYYAPCIATFADPTTTGARLLMLMGDQDALIDLERCAEAAAAMRAGGSKVELIVYAGAHHQWDGWSTAGRQMRRGLRACDLRVDEEGDVRDQRTSLPMNGPATRAMILGWCTDSDGYFIQRDDAVRARSDAALAAFLNEVYGPES